VLRQLGLVHLEVGGTVEIDLMASAERKALVAPYGVDPVAAPSARPSILVHEDGADRTVPLAKEVVTIGRLAECDIVLKDKGASRRHAQVRVKDGVATLTDLGSTNGTRLNGQTVQTRALEDGDLITIGTTTLEFRRG
jgi:pSer/pThr/pTyr-binding forkhead associated (FHA) protein